MAWLKFLHIGHHEKKCQTSLGQTRLARNSSFAIPNRCLDRSAQVHYQTRPETAASELIISGKGSVSAELLLEGHPTLLLSQVLRQAKPARTTTISIEGLLKSYHRPAYERLGDWEENIILGKNHCWVIVDLNE